MIAGDPRYNCTSRWLKPLLNLANMLRQFPTSFDEDLKVIMMLGMRTFNAFGASLKLALSRISPE